VLTGKINQACAAPEIIRGRKFADLSDFGALVDNRLMRTYSRVTAQVLICNYSGHPFSNAKRAIPSPFGGRNSAFRGKY
jgi:hypothetical protein